MEADIQRYRQTWPQYREALEFLPTLLEFQTSLAEKLAPGVVVVEGQVAHEKWQGGQPLLAGETLFIPPLLFQEALTDLRPLLTAGGPAQTALDRLLASRFMSPSALEALLENLLRGKNRVFQKNPVFWTVTQAEICLEAVAEAISADPEALAFLLKMVLSPFFKKLAQPYQAWLETAPWGRGLCLICGSEPWLARLAYENGQRRLRCSLCQVEWPFERLRCPFCGRSSRPQLRYFTVNGDEAHRVDCCDDCRRYLKTIDERAAGRPTNLWVEDIVTAHLDTLAREYGYH